ncbi:MAG: NAD(P)-dependent oxidoreductase [Muribaculaceae bacterium]|nr:NAD(P)-dependent oxidoreductase [Muribaculaceae bacterium]
MDKTLQEDIDKFALPADLIECLSNTTIVVTGATGLIGGSFVRFIEALNIGVKWILPVRNLDKASRIFPPSSACDCSITLVPTELVDFFENTDIKADYVIHCASSTNGRIMAMNPVETFGLAVESTKAALEYSRRNNVRGMVYVSSIEYYGQRHTDEPVTEEMTGYIDHRSARSSYALGKQAAEFLCFSYASEYGVPVTAARLTQTFGAGVAADDGRVFAQFARSIIAGTDLVLHTQGRSAKPYCYISDCISALAYILVKGVPGQAYNVATPGTYIDIRGLAEKFCEIFNPLIKVKTCYQSVDYAPETRINLNSDKLLSLGWKPVYGLEEMLRRLVASMRSAISGNNSN